MNQAYSHEHEHDLEHEEHELQEEHQLFQQYQQYQHQQYQQQQHQQQQQPHHQLPPHLNNINHDFSNIYHPHPSHEPHLADNLPHIDDPQHYHPLHRHASVKGNTVSWRDVEEEMAAIDADVDRGDHYAGMGAGTYRQVPGQRVPRNNGGQFEPTKNENEEKANQEEVQAEEAEEAEEEDEEKLVQEMLGESEDDELSRKMFPLAILEDNVPEFIKGDQGEEGGEDEDEDEHKKPKERTITSTVWTFVRILIMYSVAKFAVQRKCFFHFSSYIHCIVMLWMRSSC